jgi:hypothetical protein
MMGFEKVTVTGFKLEVGVGKKLQLTKQQADARKHALTPIDGDVYQVEKIVEFKAGEEIGIEVKDVPKIDLPKIETPAQASEKKKASGKSKEKTPKEPVTPPAPPAGTTSQAPTGEGQEQQTANGKTVIDPVAQ